MLYFEYLPGEPEGRLELVEFFDNAIFNWASEWILYVLELVEFFDNAIFLIFFFLFFL